MYARAAKPWAAGPAGHPVSLTDDEYKLVFSRLGDRLRIAGTAELNGYDRDLNRVRCEACPARRAQLLAPAESFADSIYGRPWLHRTTSVD